MALKREVENLFVTWSPDPKNHKGIHSPKKQYAVYEHVIDNLKYACRGIVVAEFNLANNIHYHMMLKVENTVRWRAKLVPEMKRYGFVQIVAIKNYMKCKEYLLKDAKDNSIILGFELPLELQYVSKIKKTPVHKVDKLPTENEIKVHKITDFITYEESSDNEV